MAHPAGAKLGVYDVVLERDAPRGARSSDDEEGARRSSWSSGNFRVEEFRLPLVDARISGPKAPPIAATSIAVDVQMSYFSGGAMAGAPLRASALLKPRSPGFAGYDEFSFEPARDLAKTEQPAGDSDENPSDAERNGKLIADKVALTTDRNGAAAFTLKDLPATTRPTRIEAELTFNDPNGEVQTVATQVDLWPSALVARCPAASWASNRGRARFSVVALDTAGKPVQGQAVTVRGRVSQVVTTQEAPGRRLLRLRQPDRRQGPRQPLLRARPTSAASLACEATLDAAGQVELIAEAKDAQGRAAEAAASVWVTRQGELWFAQDNDDRIDVLPEKKRYEPGETARLQVRMPFRAATALVAVEREGVIATQVVTLRGDDPTVELKIEPTWGPNVYVSVLALRGRIRARRRGIRSSPGAGRSRSRGGRASATTARSTRRRRR